MIFVRRLVLLTLSIIFLAPLFHWLESRWGERPSPPAWGPERQVNIAYWYLGPLCFQVLADVAVLAAVRYGGFEVWHAAGAGRLAGWSGGWQLLALVVGIDCLQYWIHRLLHTGPWWRWHAVHHSSETLDWLGAVRHHPGEYLINRLLIFLPLYLLGFDFAALGGWVVVSNGVDLVVHANLTWSLGPLRHLLVSPAYHRWHHATDKDAIDKNFAQIFPLWDILFGTRFQPAGRRPEAYGVLLQDVPGSLGEQLLYPWKR